jgi:DNA-binding NarL/FixJ family response regulator
VSVVFLTADLMFSSQVLGAGSALSLKVLIAGSVEQARAKLAAETRLVIVDLTLDHIAMPEVVAATRELAPHAKIVAYGPHVDEAVLLAAQSAGADLVLSRGQFHRGYANLLASVVQSRMVTPRPEGERGA